MQRTIWLVARAPFKFKEHFYATGDVLPALPLEAVQLRARRLVSFSKAPEEARAKISESRRRGRPRKLAAEAISAEIITPGRLLTPYDAQRLKDDWENPSVPARDTTITPAITTEFSEY